MAKKKPTKKVVNGGLSALRKRVQRTPEQYIEHLITVSERSISEHGNAIDEFFTQQAVRLKRELKELKERK